MFSEDIMRLNKKNKPSFLESAFLKKFTCYTLGKFVLKNLRTI